VYVTAIHQITDPEKFQQAVRAATPPVSEFPAGIVLHSTYSNVDGTKAVCLWEAETVEGGAGSRRLGRRSVQPERVLRGEQGDRNGTAGLIARRTPPLSALRSGGVGGAAYPPAVYVWLKAIAHSERALVVPEAMTRRRRLSSRGT
jgi:hypothetical protein